MEIVEVSDIVSEPVTNISDEAEQWNLIIESICPVQFNKTVAFGL